MAEPPPVINAFDVRPTSISRGQSATMEWNVSGADLVSIDQGIGTVVASGSRSVSPSQSTGYTLTVTKAGATPVTQSIILTVNQPAPAITKFTASPLTLPAAGGTVTLTWTTTDATSISISPLTVVLPTNGTTSVTIQRTTTFTLTAVAGTSSNSTSASATVTVGGTTNTSRPAINAHGIVTVASGSEIVSPLSLISIYGQRFTNNVTQNWNGSNLTTTLAGVSVSVDGRPAYPLYVSPTFLNFEAPDTPNRGSLSVIVSNAAGTSDPVSVQVAALAPEFKGWTQTYVEANRAGPNPIASPGCPYPACPVGPDGVVPYATPAKPGETVSLWALGFGPSNPPIAAGVIGGVPEPLVNSVSVTIGGTPVTIPYGAFLQGVGLYQFNIIVPSLPDGEYDLSATVNGVKTLKTMKFAIRR